MVFAGFWELFCSDINSTEPKMGPAIQSLSRTQDAPVDLANISLTKLLCKDLCHDPWAAVNDTAIHLHVVSYILIG